jgi:hypothetical protein
MDSGDVFPATGSSATATWRSGFGSPGVGRGGTGLASPAAAHRCGVTEGRCFVLSGWIWSGHWNEGNDRWLDDGAVATDALQEGDDGGGVCWSYSRLM